MLQEQVCHTEGRVEIVYLGWHLWSLGCFDIRYEIMIQRFQLFYSFMTLLLWKYIYILCCFKPVNSMTCALSTNAIRITPCRSYMFPS